MHVNGQEQIPDGKKPTSPARTHGPGGGTAAGLLALQSTAGNAAVVQMLRAADHSWSQDQHRHNAGCDNQQTGQPAVQRSTQALSGPLRGDSASASASTSVQRKVPGGGAPEEHYADNPSAHPEWALFQGLMKTAGFSQDTVEGLWQLILGGLKEQENINAGWKSEKLTRAELRPLLDSNGWYEQGIKMLRENKGFVTPNMALWSGGLDVCKYAETKGYTPMEFTRAGKVLNELEYHKDWRLQGPLWNLLSKFYVSQATGPVHIFLRSYSPESVLIGQEVPQLQQLQRFRPDVELIWHPLYTTEDGTIREISRDRTLVDDSTFPTRDSCVAALYDFLRYHHDEGNQKAAWSHREMGEDLEKNINTNGMKS
ncbi:hypothetical protein [Streptomyces sp. NPDC001744]|uniref:hypothetical protein n=1 Tax=Streptomyces sp. NPDC001744 TaxID=3364606 RepID=UPI0036C8B857